MLELTGCSIKTPYLSITQWPVAKKAIYYGDPSPYRVAILPLADRRPIHEKEGKRPGGMFLLLWNHRVGDYYTGDHVFGDHVTQQLTHQLTEYLRSSNAFAHVVEVETPAEFNPSDVVQVTKLGRAQVVDYLLGGEVQHFFGSQSQHTSIFLLPLYFINTFSWQDSKTLPWGKTAIHFVLYDGRSGDIVWRRFIEANQTLPRDSDPMSEAALESFTNAAGELAVNLRNLPLGVAASAN